MKADVELADYLAEAPIIVSEDPFAYWKGKKGAGPNIVKLPKKYLYAPGGSIKSERLFSTAGHIINELQRSLTPENLKMILLLHHNLPILNYEY